MATVKFSADLPPEVVESFDDFCTKRGYVKRKAVIAAFSLLQWAPADLRDLLMEGNSQAVQEWFERVNELFGRSVADVLKRAQISAGEERSARREKASGNR